MWNETEYLNSLETQAEAYNAAMMQTLSEYMESSVKSRLALGHDVSVAITVQIESTRREGGDAPCVCAP